MLYGKIRDNKIISVINADDSARGYSGNIFYNADGTVMSAVDVITSQNLKSLIVPAECTKPMSYYTFTETSSAINVSTTLTEEANTKIAAATKSARIAYLKKRLTALSEDFAQDIAGVPIADIATRKAEFVTKHAELRVLKGLAPRTTL